MVAESPARVVRVAWAGAISSSTSVSEVTSQLDASHRQRRLRHTRRTGRPNAGRSTTPTALAPWTERDHTTPPQLPQVNRALRVQMCPACPRWELTVGAGGLGSAPTGPIQSGRAERERPMGPEDAEGGGGTAAQDATEGSAPRPEPITTENPQRPTERRAAVTAARRTVAATRGQQGAAGNR